jgi:hypothetical protein
MISLKRKEIEYKNLILKANNPEPRRALIRFHLEYRNPIRHDHKYNLLYPQKTLCIYLDESYQPQNKFLLTFSGFLH